MSTNEAGHRSLWERVLTFARRHRSHIIAALTSLGITVLVVVFATDLRRLASLGYLGVFAISVISNATVVLPVPGIAVVFAGGGVLNPLLVALIAGVGEPIGELSGYLAGFAGSAVVEDREHFEKIRVFMERRGFLTLLVLSAFPNPLFDLAGITAGMMRVPVSRFLLACWIGKTIKSLAIAYLGSLSFGIIVR
ncbi:MAG: VTT domain-containing protein [Anaerolineae bacterium]